MDDFENEIEPALLLCMFSQKELNLKIETEVNPNDPPDHFATINGTKNIGLELTQLAKGSIHEKNSFLALIHNLITESIDRHKSTLPNGKYLAFYELGETIMKDEWRFTVSNENKIAKSKLSNQIEVTVQNLIGEFSGSSKSAKILNKKGQQIGIIHLSLNGNSTNPEVYTFPQIMRTTNTTPDFITTQIQKTITDKENLYKDKYLNSTFEWWLLIHDIKNYLNTDLFVQNIENCQFKHDFFTKVLLIRPSFGSFKITDLKSVG